MYHVDFDFSQLVCFLVLFRFWCCLGGFRVPALPYFFEVRDHFLSCFKESAIMSASSAKRRFDIQSLFSLLSLMPKPFSFQVSLSFTIAAWRTELKRRLLKGSPCFVPRAIPNSSLSTSVSTVPRWSVYTISGGRCIVH